MVQPWVIFGTTFQIAKAVHYFAVGIEFNIRWRLLCNLRFLVCHVIAINDEDVILCVHAYTADLSDYPFSRQRLRPVGIDNIFCSAVLCLSPADYSQGDDEAYAKPNLSETPYLPLHVCLSFLNFTCARWPRPRYERPRTIWRSARSFERASDS